MRTRCNNRCIILKDSSSRTKRALGINYRTKRKDSRNLRESRCFTSRNMRKKKPYYSKKSNSMRINSKNNPKKKNSTIQSSETQRKSTPLKSRKCKRGMSNKIKSSNLRSMNSKIMFRNLRITIKKRRKNYIACNQI